MLFVTESKNSILLSHLKRVFDVFVIAMIVIANSPQILHFLLWADRDFVQFWPLCISWNIALLLYVIAWGALSATAMFYYDTCIVLYMHCCTGDNYRTATMQCHACYQWTSVNQSWWCQLDRNCDQLTSTTTNVVDVTACYSASAPSQMRTTMADGHKFQNDFKVTEGHP